ncbi:MAG: glycosyltransferase family 2 protein [Candidatus Peribacteraceae bacterium]|nr:glycosyltransferase family 2 protein [Candidatus Peribacteraceae bacterium]
MPKNMISVIIPAYNEEDVIEKSITSVLNSTYKNYEIIVVNNGSTDKTPEIVDNYVKKHPKKIRLLNFAPDSSKEFIRKRGVSFSRNRAAEVASGDILFFLDADDWVIEDTLGNIIKSFEKYRGIDFICGDRRTVTAKGWKKIFLYHWMVRERFRKRPERVLDSGSFCPYIVKTKEFFKAGKFNEEAYYSEDTEFARRLEKMKKKKLDSTSIVYYTDMGASFKDYNRQCSNMSKRFYIYPFKSISIVIQLLMFIFAFPLVYFSLFSRFMWRTGDIMVSIFSPFMWGMRRVLEIYHFVKLIIK